MALSDIDKLNMVLPGQLFRWWIGIGRQAYRHREAYNGTIYKSGVDLGILRGDTLTGAGCLQPAKSDVCPPDKFF